MITLVTAGLCIGISFKIEKLPKKVYVGALIGAIVFDIVCGFVIGAK